MHMTATASDALALLVNWLERQLLGMADRSRHEALGMHGTWWSWPGRGLTATQCREIDPEKWSREAYRHASDFSMTCLDRLVRMHDPFQSWMTV